MYCCDDCKLSHKVIHSRECQQICLYDLDEMARLSLRLVWSLANTHTPSGSSSVIVTRDEIDDIRIFEGCFMIKVGGLVFE